MHSCDHLSDVSSPFVNRCPTLPFPRTAHLEGHLPKCGRKVSVGTTQPLNSTLSVSCRLPESTAPGYLLLGRGALGPRDSPRPRALCQRRLMCFHAPWERVTRLGHLPLCFRREMDDFLADIPRCIEADSIVWLAGSVLSYFMTWFHLSP